MFRRHNQVTQHPETGVSKDTPEVLAHLGAYAVNCMLYIETGMTPVGASYLVLKEIVADPSISSESGDKKEELWKNHR